MSENAIIEALQLVRSEERKLQDFAEKNGLSVSVHIGSSGGRGLFVHITSRHQPIIGDRLFLGRIHGGKTIRNSTVAYAGTLEKAEAIILEAAQAADVKRAEHKRWVEKKFGGKKV